MVLIVIGKSEQAVTAWEVMLSLLLRGSINFLCDKLDVSGFPFERVLLESIICCATKVCIFFPKFCVIYLGDVQFKKLIKIKLLKLYCLIKKLYISDD